MRTLSVESSKILVDVLLNNADISDAVFNTKDRLLFDLLLDEFSWFSDSEWSANKYGANFSGDIYHDPLYYPSCPNPDRHTVQLTGIRVVYIAHQYCQGLTAYWFTRGLDIVVSNTFTQRWELDPYLKLDPNARLIRCTSNYGSIHNVPEPVIEAMKARFEDIEGEEFYHP